MTTFANSLKFAGLDVNCLDRVVGSAPVGVFVCTVEGRICYANQSSNKISERKEDSNLIGLNFFDLEWIRNGDLQGKFTRLLNEAQPFQDELLEFQGPQGRELHLSLKAFPLEDRDTGQKGFVCFVQDCSEPAHLKKNLKDRLRQLSIINEISLALSTTLNTEQILETILIGATCGQGLGFNRVFLLLLDESQNRLVGKMGLGTSDPQEAGRIWEELSKKKLSFNEVLQSYGERARQTDMEVERIVENLKISMDDDENILVHAVKKRIPLNSEEHLERVSASFLGELLGTESFAVAPLVSKDKVRGVIIADNLITSKPITDEGIKLLQIFASQASVAMENSELYNELTSQVKKLEAANKALAQNTEKMIMIEKFSTIGQITSTVAHQLRNPMTIIGGFARSLTKKVSADDPNYHSLETIAQEVERMEDILNRLSDFTPKPKMRLQEGSINQAIEDSLNLLNKELVEAGITVTRDLTEGLGSLWIDAEQLQVALVNVFRNCIQAMASGGELKVTTRISGNEARIEIKDKGPGIPEKEMKHIFDPFYTTRENADGLGLTIASEIVKNYNGRMWAESQEGEGTSVFINLPMKRGEHQ